MESCLVLFSGGIDSTTALYWARSRYQNVQALTFDYGQKHRIEIELSKKLARKIRIPQKILRIDLKQIGGSCLTDESIPVPAAPACSASSYPDSDAPPEPPSTYVPFRNGIFLSMSAAWAEVKNIARIVCGFNTIDSPNYPDTRLPFVKAAEKAINLGTKAAFGAPKIQILAPFIHMKKSEIIKTGLSLGADYSYSVSCYSGGEIPCSACSSCSLRQKAWEEAGAEDHLILRLQKERKL